MSANTCEISHIRWFLRYLIAGICFFLSFASTGFAQVTQPPDSIRSQMPDSVRQRMQQQQSMGNRPGQMGAAQQQGQQGNQEGPQPVQFQASDSLVFTFEDQRKATLFGSAKVTHPSGNLSAGKVSMNLDKHLVEAETETPQDTLSQPVLQRKNDKIKSNRILFNYKTQKGKFNVARVDVQQGKLTGMKVKKMHDNVIFIENGIYSTCKLDHPHYYIKAKKMKVVNREEIFFTNAKLYILDIPYPMIFPFGYVPAKMERHQSGILPPTYAMQNKQTRGLGLQNLGWFQYFNDYLTGQASVDIFTSGTFLGDAQLNYRKRDSYSGSIRLGYSREQGLEKTDPGFSKQVNRRLNISHNQDFSPYASMNANINLRTADYFQRNSYDINDRAQTTSSSRISYRYKDPGDAFTFSLSAQQSQDFKNNTAQITGPKMSFNLRSISPFQKQGGGGRNERKWYESLNLNYSNSFDSRYRFDPVRGDSANVNWFQALTNPSKYREATDNLHYIDYAFKQNGSMSLSNLIPSQFINTSASFNINEYWYPATLRKSFNADSNRVEDRLKKGFTAARDFSTGVSMSTTFYGIWNKNISNLEGFRHTVRPSLSFSYRPDFSSDFWGYYRTVQTDTLGHTRKYSIFENGLIGGPGAGEQRALSFNLDNVFETKQVKRDSTGEKHEKTLRLIDQLNGGLSYNFAADSLNLSQLRTSFSSSVVKGLRFSANANFDFYARDSLGRRINRFLWNTSGRLAQMTSFNLTASTRFSGGQQGGMRMQETQPNFPAHYNPLNQRVFHNVDPTFNTQPVQNVDVPWSLSLSFTYSWNYRFNRKPTRRAVLNAQNIQFQLTPKWSVSTQLGYDFIQHKLTPSRFSMHRSLHMWNLNFQMNPFGEFQFYLFSLTVNDSQLQSLFQKLPILNNLKRSSGTLNRGY